VTDSKPKTQQSRRSVALDPETIAVLRAHRRQQVEERLSWGEAYEETDLVFAREDGSPIRPDTITRRFQELAKACGLRPLRLHDLRHTYATIASTNGTHPRVVADRLGHSTTAITLDIYSRVIPSVEEQAASRIAGLIFGPTAVS
jgi:integrase